MKKLSKDQLTRKAELLAAIQKKREALEMAIEQFNMLVAEEFSKLESLVEDYNGAITDCSDFRDEIATDQTSYIEERSEKWIESDAGQAYIGWKEEWENATFDSISLEQPTEVEWPEWCDEAFDELPDELEL